MRKQFLRKALLPILTLLCLIGSAYDVSATHFRYGSISWRKVATTSQTTETIEFKVSMGFRRTYFTPLPVEGATVAANCNLVLTGPGVSSVSIPVNIKITTINPTEDWLYGEVLITRAFPKSAVPKIAKAEILQCCRISTLKLGKDTDFKFSTMFNLGSDNNNSPVTTVPPIVNCQTGLSAATFNLPASDADGDAYTFRLATTTEMAFNPPGLTVNPTTGLVTLNTVGKVVGDLYAVQLIITDSKGASVPADFIIQIVKQSTPPIFDYTVTPVDEKVFQIIPGQYISFPVVAKDIDPGSTVTLSAVGVPVGAQFAPALPRTGNPVNTVFSWTPSATQFGSFVVNFTATDNDGSQTSSSVSIVVSLKPRFDVPPTPEEEDHIVVEPGTLVSFPVVASDPDANDLVRIISAEHAPATATFSTTIPTIAGNPTSTQVSWTPLVSDWGEHHIEFTAEDTHGDQATHEVGIVVNTTPVFTSTPVTQVKEGQLYYYLITGYDPDVNYGDHVEVRGFGIPAWLTLTDNGDGTALLSGTPTSADVDTYQVGINLEDLNHHGNVGGMPTQLFEIEVLPCDLVTTLLGTNISCLGKANGAIDLTIGGGTAPFTISWSNGASTEDLAALAPGNYNAEVTDKFGCVSYATDTISEPAILIANASQQTPETCPTSADGVAVVVISGGTAPYTSTWVGGVTGEISSGLTTGNYGVDVIDANGCKTSSVATINHNDTQAPVAKAKNITVFLNASGVAVLSVNDINNGSTDNCTIAAIVLDKTTFNGSNLGTNNVVLTVKDHAGLSSSATAVVTVLDNTPPVAVTKNVTIYLNAAGLASITAADVNNGSHDNNAITALSVSKTNFNYTNIGANTVLLTVTDASGLTASAPAIVSVLDNIAPVISTKDVTIYLAANGTASIAASDIDNGSSDNGSIASRVVSKNSFNCSNVGVNTVTLTVTDFGGNAVSANAIVTVIDNIAPVAIAKNVTLYLNAAGIATLAPADIDNGSSDNCSIVSYSVSKTTFNGSNLGNTPVVLTVKDAAGLSSSATAIVTIADNTKPTVVTKNITVTIGGSGTTTITPGDVDNGSSDNSGTPTITLSKTTFDCSNLGPNTVVVTATDASGNVATGTAIVTVTDELAPVALVKNITVQLNASGFASISAASIDNGSTDNCGINTYAISKESFNCSNVGANTVILTITDISGNVVSANAIVTVIDNIAPVAIAKNVTLYLNASGIATLAPADIDNGSSDNCSIVSYTVDKATFTVSDLGTTQVLLTVKDAGGLSSSATAIVTIADNTKPTVVTKNITVTLGGSGITTITPGDVDNGSSDNSGAPTITLSKSTFDCSNLGANTVVVTATDASGNVSTGTAIVTVTDPIAPVSLVKNITVQLNASGLASITPASVDNGSTDNCGVVNYAISKNSFNCSNVGANTVIFTVTDISGNAVSANAIVTVIDNIAPVAIAKNVTLYLNAAGIATLAPADIDNGSSDNCSIVTYTVDKVTFNGSKLGNTPVVLTVKDAAGLSSSATAIVTIADNIKPTVVTKNITVTLGGSGTTTITPGDVDNGSSDNAGTPTITLSKTSFDCSNLGANTVVVTLTDASGNVSTGTSIVTVTDAIAPVALVKNITVQLNASGLASITPASVNNGSTDNCGITSYTISKSSFNCSNVGANNVVLTVKDASGNTFSATAVVTVLDNPAILNLTFNAPKVIGNYNTSCNTLGDGAVNLTVTGGTLPYSVSWSNGATGTALANLLAGTYTVTVSDINGCSRSSAVTLTKPENCDCITTPATAPAYTCNRSIDGTTNALVNGGTVCINTSYTGDINFQSGTLVIKGSATIPNFTLNAGCTLVVIGSLKSDYINLNAASASIINYGKIDVTQNVSPSGLITNYNVFNILNIYNNNTEGKLINKGTFYVKNDANINGKAENYASLIVDGTFANNSGSSLLNKCSIRAKNVNSGANTVITNNGTIAAVETTTLNTNTITVTSGSIIKTKNLTAGSASINNSQAGCALVKVSNYSTINGLNLTGPISLCDAFNGIETSTNLNLFNGANLSCLSCSYSGTLATTARADADLNDAEIFANKKALVVYPNPSAQSDVTLNINGAEFKYKIIDMHGFVVSEKSSEQGFAKISTAKLSSGLYIVEAIDETGVTYLEKLVVQ